MRLALCSFLLLLTACLAGAQEAENRYDLFTHSVMPLLLTFVPEHPQHALRIEGRLLKLTNQPPILANARVAVATEYPDKVRLEITLDGQTYTLARDGQRIWAAPGAKVQAWLAAIPKLPKPHLDFQLAPMELPFDIKQMALLPILFQVGDAGSIDVAGQKSQVLDITLMPELARAVKVEDWAARLWIRADQTPAQLKLTHEDWQMTVALDKVQTGAAFPPETWQPIDAQKSDVLEISPVKLKQLIDLADKQIRHKN